MKVGDLVKYRREAVDAGVGIVVKPGIAPAWWSILWSNGATESVRIGNLKVLNESR